MLVLSWHFRAATMCEYSREEFVSGMLRPATATASPKLQQKLTGAAARPAGRPDIQGSHFLHTYSTCTCSSSLQEAPHVPAAASHYMHGHAPCEETPPCITQSRR